MIAIGIDLGTTNSAAALASGKDVRVLPTRGGEQLTPSVVSYFKKFKAEGGEIVVGRQAVANAARDPVNTIYSIKRLMGHLYGERWQVYDGFVDLETLRQHISYQIAEAPPASAEDQGVKVMLGGTAYTPVDISAMIIRQVKADAEQALGQPVTHAVITVPAYFTERQRAATVKAGEQAGLKVLQVLDEPTAAALAFGAGKEDEKHRVLVFDLGGGTFDISIIQMRNGQYVQLEVLGDNWLGGDDFDRKIVERIISTVKNEFNTDPSTDRPFLAKAKEEAEKAKRALSTMESVDIFMPLVKLPGVLGTVDVQMALSRKEFEDDIRPLVSRAIDLVQTALRNKSLKPDQISEVLMVGGSTAVPLVQDSVAALFGRDRVKRHVNPMECVALGAAILAATFPLKEEPGAPARKEGPSVKQTTATHLGIAAIEGANPNAFVPIIRKGTPYPLKEPAKHVFYPARDRQTMIRLPVYEGLNALASLNELQGMIEFRLPEGIGAQTPIEVTFNFDANRSLTVEVRVLTNPPRVHKETVQRDRGVKQQTLMEDWREELDPAIRACKIFLESFGDFMEPADREELRDAIQRGDQALDRNNQPDGMRARDLLRNKLFSSGVASELFWAEQVMSGASPGETKHLTQLTTALRQAYKAGRQEEVARLRGELRTRVALLLQQRGQRIDDADRWNTLVRNPTGGSQ